MRHSAKKLRAFSTSHHTVVGRPAIPLLFERTQMESDVRYVLKKVEAWGWLMKLDRKSVV